MAQHYSNPKRANDVHALPDVETFQVTMIGNTRDGLGDCPLCDDPGLTAPYKVGVSAQHTDHVGWYWQSCFPGCLPDGDPNGPFATEAKALEDAREGVSEDDEDEADADDPEDDPEDEPGDEDYYLSDDERSIVYLGRRIVGPTSETDCSVCSQPLSAHLNVDGEQDSDHTYAPFKCNRDATMKALADYVRADQYWPNVWAISDHGNAALISVLDCGCYFTEHDGRPELHDDANRCRSCGHEYATNEHCGECRDGMKG